MKRMRNNDIPFNIDFNIEEEPIAVEIVEEIEESRHIYTQEDIDAARREGLSEGHKKGFEEGIIRGELSALTKNEKDTTKAFVHIFEYIKNIHQKEAYYEKHLLETTLELSMAIIQKIFPIYSNKHGLGEIEGVVRYILSTLLDHQDIKIFLATENIDDLYNRIEEIQTCFPNKLTLHSDNSLKAGECRIKWQGGGARWSQPIIFENIQNIFTRFIQSSHKEIN